MNWKKGIVTILVMLIIVCNSFIVTKASGLNEVEQTILNKIKIGITIDGVTVCLLENYIDGIEQVLNENTIDITKEQSEEFLTKLSQARAMMQNIDLEEIEKLRGYDSVHAIVTLVNEAVEIIGYDFPYDSLTRNLTIVNQNGTIVLADVALQETGIEVKPLFISIGVLAILLILCFVFAIRTNLTSNSKKDNKRNILQYKLDKNSAL